MTTYDSDGIESGPSAPISYIVPGGLTIPRKTSAADPTEINFSVASGHTYQVQASEDLVTWTTIWETTAVSNQWIHFRDPASAGMKNAVLPRGLGLSAFDARGEQVGGGLEVILAAVFRAITR